MGKESSSANIENEKNLEEVQNSDTSQLGVGGIGNLSAQVPVNTSTYMLEGRVQLACSMPANVSSALTFSTSNVDRTRDLLEKFPSSIRVGHEDITLRG